MKKQNVQRAIGLVFCGSLILSYFIGQELQLNKAANESNSGKSISVSSDFKLESANKLVKSAPFEIVQKYEIPVLERGSDGEWDSVDLLNPSVIERDGIYYNYYSGYDGEKWSTGLATSTDGIKWEKYKNNPIITLSDEGWDSSYIAANGAAVFYNDMVYYYYQGTNAEGLTEIGLAISEDGVNFVKKENAVLTCGATGTWDSQVTADPYVIEHDGKLFMYYLGMNDLNVQKLGVAVSEDGINWVKSKTNPVMDVGVKGSFDENGLGEPSIYYEAPYFYMLYTGRDSQEVRNIGLAYSLDGINWYKNNYDGLMELEDDTWDSKVICDTTFIYNEAEELLYVWYGGGDNAEPAENLNGNVGLFTVDISQKRDMYNFDTKADWNESKVSSEEVLKGSYAIEEGQAWVSDNISIDLKNNKNSDTLVISGYMPFQNYQVAGIDNVTMSVYINNELVSKNVFGKEELFNIEVKKMDEIQLADELNICILTDACIVPAQVGISQDERRLAYVLNQIEQR